LISAEIFSYILTSRGALAIRRGSLRDVSLVAVASKPPRRSMAEHGNLSLKASHNRQWRDDT
jgi:hypothetical protein